MRSRSDSGPVEWPGIEIHRGPRVSCRLRRDPSGRLVVIKVTHPGACRADRRRLAVQAQRAKVLDHPGVLQPLLVDQLPGPGTTWPFIPGRDLTTRLARHGPLDPDWAEEVVAGVESTIADLHRRRRVHGAVEPAHVLLGGDGSPVLIGVDPGAKWSVTARRADQEAVARLRDLLVGSGDTSTAGCAMWDHATNGVGMEPANGVGQDLRLAGPGASPWRRRVPLAAGIAVTLIGAAVAATSTEGASTCTAPIGGSTEFADVDGDGCDERLTWSAALGELRAETASGPVIWRLGRPGDELLLEDWDCDGLRTPGLHRPSTGRTYAFDRWPTDGPARAVLVPSRTRCRTPGSDEGG